MPTFEYEATVKSNSGEEVTEWGTVVAPSQTAAEDKLKQLGLVPTNMKVLRGIKSLLKSFTADVK